MAQDHPTTDPASLMRQAGLDPDPWQEAVLASSSQQLLLMCSRQAGKSTVAAALAVKAALHQAPALVLLLSPTLRQSGELFRAKVQPLYRALSRSERIVQESALQMELANGSRIISLPGDEQTIRGYSGVTLLVIDEAARVPDDLYRAVRPMLAVSGGRLVALSTPFGKRGWFYQEWHGSGPWERTRITAYECPRIPRDFLADEERALGKDWFAQEYLCEFTDSGASPLFPSEWLDRAARIAESLRGRRRDARAIGCDPAEGGDRSVWAVIDEYGLLDLLSLKTPDTSVITGQTIALMRKWNVPAERVVFDRGGGGKEHADRLRSQGHRVQTVAFGEAVQPDLKRGQRRLEEKVEDREERYTFKNRRAALYWDLRQLLDPTGEVKYNGRKLEGFGLPAEQKELRRQLAPMPLLWDEEGRVMMLPKNRRDPESDKPTLTELIGCSPDEADALVCAVYGLLHSAKRATAGAF